MNKGWFIRVTCLSIALAPMFAAPLCAEPARPTEIVETPISKVAALSFDGRQYPYVTTAGTIPIRSSDGTVTAEMFYVAYTLIRKADAPARPVTFAFNGGPGSSSSPLLLASFGPMRVNLELPQPALATAAVKTVLSPNDASLLDRTDLVFLDAIGTGYSHAVGKASNRDFWGVDEDIGSFSKAITGWLQANKRWASPVAIVGESYAGTRAAGLAPLLPAAGVRLRGVVLISPGLSAPSLDLYSDIFFATLLPSYAAAAWYHRSLVNRPRELKPFLDEVSRYALGTYLSALAQGGRLAPASKMAVAKQLAGFTGLEADVILKSNLRINLQQFRKKLLSAQGLTIGELDDRQTGVDLDRAAAEPETDPASIIIREKISAAVNAYLSDELGYAASKPYRYNDPASQDLWNWMRSKRDYYPWVNRPAYIDLATAVTRYPAIHVITLMGYYDFASPFLQTEYDLAHMPLAPELAGNFVQRHYESGHMMYVNPACRHQMKDDLDRFFDEHVIDLPDDR